MGWTNPLSLSKTRVNKVITRATKWVGDSTHWQTGAKMGLTGTTIRASISD